MNERTFTNALLSLNGRGIKPYDAVGNYTVSKVLGVLSEETQQRVSKKGLYEEDIRNILHDCVSSAEMPFWDEKINELMDNANYMTGLIAKRRKF